MFKSTPVVKSIFYANLFVFLVSIIFPNTIFGLFSLQDPRFFYQLITYQFLHAGILHIFFNMLVFLSFAPTVEEVYGGRKMWIYYLLCGVFGGLLHYFLAPGSQLVGASAAIWGIMVIFTLLDPDSEVFLFFIPIPIKIKYITSIAFLFELASCFSQNDNVSHFGHVGGALTGASIFLLNKYKIIK